jgi:MFS family permease
VAWRPYHTVWAILALTWTSSYMVRIALAPLLRPLGDAFDLSYAQAGFLATAYFYGYAAVQIPAGYLGDRVGKKRVIMSGILGWTVLSVATGLAGSYPALFVCRLLTGVAAGMLFSNDRSIIAAATPPQQMGRGQGLSFAGVGLGLCLGMLLAGQIGAAYGWRAVFVSMALPGLLAAVLVGWLISEPKLSHPPGISRAKAPLRPVFENIDLWLLNVGGMVNIYTYWLVAIWAPAIFQDSGVQDLATASAYASVIGLSIVAGLLVGGVLSDRLESRGIGRKNVIAVSYLATAGVMVLLGVAVAQRASAAPLIGLIFLAGVLIAGAWSPQFALLPALVPADVLGTAYGLSNSVWFIGSLLAPWATGSLKDATGSFAWGCYAAAGLNLIGMLAVCAMPPRWRWRPAVVPAP